MESAAFQMQSNFFQGENWQSEKNIQQQENVAENGKRNKINRENFGIWCIDKFNSTLEENCYQSQQSNENQSADETQNHFDESTSEIRYETASIHLKRLNNLLCFERNDKRTNRRLLGLIDMRSKFNYISKENAQFGKILKLKKPFFVETIYGQTPISHFVFVNLFSHDIPFLIVDFLQNFDFTLGMGGLRKINATIDFMSLELIFKSKIKTKVDICHELIEKTEFEDEKIEACKGIETVKNVETNKSEQLHENAVDENIRKLNIVKNQIYTNKTEIVKVETGKTKIERNVCHKTDDRVVSSKIQAKYKMKILKKIIGKLKLGNGIISLLKTFYKDKAVWRDELVDFKYFEPG